MCIANDKEVTKYVLESFKFCNCCSYKTVYILLLIFGYLAAICAWILTSGGWIAITWDALYSLLCIIATIVLWNYNYIYMIALLIPFIADVVIVAVAVIVIIVLDDVAWITGDSDSSRAVLIAGLSAFFVVQIILSIILVKIMRDIQKQTADGLPEDDVGADDRNDIAVNVG